MYKKLASGLIVSCQAAEGEVFHGLGLMRYMAKAAKAGGAAGIRALADEIPSIREETDLPVIGLVKKKYEGSEVYITPTRREADVLLETGCDVIAIDATARPRPQGETAESLFSYIKKAAPGIAVMADCDTLESALAADKIGFDYAGTTMRGYTRETAGIGIPDYAFLKEFCGALRHAKPIAEGGIWEAGQLKKVLECKPYAVVIGTAITRPADITARFTKIMAEVRG